MTYEEDKTYGHRLYWRELLTSVKEPEFLNSIFEPLIKLPVDLSGANLRGADLRGAYLFPKPLTGDKHE